ncbi:MAG: WxL domain-containing protein [Streptococcaceae bacterium]|nr:WxL domain-containing protein [Streptococcaceae bacterium]
MLKNSATRSVVGVLGLAFLTSYPVAATTNGSTPVIVDFIEDTGMVAPVNPNQPDGGHSDGKDGDGFNRPTENEGVLTLDVIPEWFDFGVQEVDMQEHTYTDIVRVKEVNGQQKAQTVHYLQVSDKRDSSSTGWQLTVHHASVSDRLNNGQQELKGAYLTIPKGVVRNSLSANTSSATDTLTSYQVEVADTAKVIFQSSSADSKSGKGQSTNTFLPGEVRLTIPKGVAKAGTYQAKVTWTLQASAEN